MKLTKLQLLNFRCFEDATIDRLSDYNLFAGFNGQGKSTILDAIAVALTGTCRGADTGRALGELRRKGSRRKWGVELNADVPDESGSGYRKLGRTEGEGPRSKTQEHVDELLGLDGARIRACLYSGELLQLDRKAAQKLLVNMAPSATVRIPVPLIEELSAFATEDAISNMKADLDMKDLDTLYGQVFGMRTTVGQELRALGDGEAAEPMPPADKYRKMRLVDVEASVAGMKTKIEDLRGTGNRIRAALEDLTSGEQRLEERHRQLTERSKEDVDVPGGIDEEMEGLSSQVNELVKKKTAIAQNIKHLQGMLASEKHEAGAARESLQAMRETGAGCHICGTKLTAAKKKNRMAALLEQADVKDTKAKETSEQLGGEMQRERQIAGEANEISVRYQTLEIRKNGLGRRLQEAADNKAALEKVTKQLIDLAQRKEEGLATLEQEALDVARRITKGDERVDVLTRYVGMRTEYERQGSNARRDLQRRHDALTRLVEAFGPKGDLRAELAGGDEMAEFLGTVKRKLVALGFAEVALEPLLALEDDIHVDGLPTRMLSDSQQLLFGLAFQVAIADVTGLGIVCIDRWESFDAASAKVARQLIKTSSVQAFVFQVLRDRDRFIQVATKANATDTTSMYLVEKGAVRAPQEAAA